MKEFAKLLLSLAETTSILKKVSILKQYFAQVNPAEASYALFILAGGKVKRRVSSTELRAWVSELRELPLWLIEESYEVVGDLAETVSLLVSSATTGNTQQTLEYWIKYLELFDSYNEEVKREKVLSAWRSLSQHESLVFTKLITGGLRIGVQKALVIRAIAELKGIPETHVAERLSGSLELHPDLWQRLISAEYSGPGLRPYPFYLAYGISGGLEVLGDPTEWMVEWKWDGIRAQIVKREGKLAVWSRGEELMTERFPEFSQLLDFLPDGTVLDGELICWQGGEPLPFSRLQTRVTRKKMSKKDLESAPVKLIAYDLLEFDNLDIRSRSFEERRKMLTQVIPDADTGIPVLLSPLLEFPDWSRLSELRSLALSYKAEGLMVKRKSAPYGVGRRRGDWWKWKVDPYSIDAVLLYAQKGHGRRANLYTDYTFAVWNGDKLVPFAKAYSGLTDKEIYEVDAFIKRHTIEKFGPVRTVQPKLVFEIGFEGIQESKRHKSGIAVRFPRILRMRGDKRPEEADNIEVLKGLAGLE